MEVELVQLRLKQLCILSARSVQKVGRCYSPILFFFSYSLTVNLTAVMLAAEVGKFCVNSVGINTLVG